MNFKQAFATGFSALAAAAFLVGSANASMVIGGQTYNVTAPTESMTATFLNAAGGVSSNLYGGLVQLTVSGTGQSLGNQFNDAFYLFSGGPPIADGSYYQLTTDNAPLVGNNPAQDAKRFIVYDVDSNTEILTRPYVPAYRAAHTYTFVVDLSLLGVAGTSHLHFGVSDGVYSDNSGAYAITISQLTAVPEPGTLALVAISGLGMLAASRRRASQA